MLLGKSRIRRIKPKDNTGFKIPRWQRRAGSIPASGTKISFYNHNVAKLEFGMRL